MSRIRHDICRCLDAGDQGLERLLELVAAGVSQPLASRLVWGRPRVLAAYSEALAEFGRAWGQVADLVLEAVS